MRTKLENEHGIRIMVTVDEIMLNDFGLDSRSRLDCFPVSTVTLV
jgi:hypothetical protein